mmetsp:Transcript_9870/g.29338  ORF Transcript_9870/g.29338 Transcript_9870/m.29338 type:complete len:93 (-) Transcript_9870:1170-1448(-)
MYMTYGLGDSIETLADLCDDLGFHAACVQLRRRHKLSDLDWDAHAEAPLLRHLQVHGAPVETAMEISTEERRRALLYGFHSSATWDTPFFRQ